MMNFLISFLLLAAPAQTQGTNGLDCIYQRSDVSAILASVRASQSDAAASEDDKAARDRFLQAALQCRKSNNWSEEQGSLAISYAVGRAAFESANQRLKAAGVDHDLIGEIVAKLTSDQRKQVLSGDFQALVPVVDPLLQRYLLQRFPQDQALSLSRIAGEGTMGFLLQADAMERFRP